MKNPTSRPLGTLSVVSGLIVLLLFASASVGSAATITTPLSEADKQPILLTFAATPGVLLLCDTNGADGNTIPLFKNGAWGCWTSAAALGRLVSPSDSVTFSPRPNDALNPTQVVVCSDPDPRPDAGDSTCTLAQTGDLAIQELGTEGTGPEETLYSPAGVGSVGFATIPKGSGPPDVAAYNIISDTSATTVPGPATLLTVALGAASLAGSGVEATQQVSRPGCDDASRVH